jgi:hypothetical protein
MTFNSGRAGIVLLTAFAGIACEPAQSPNAAAPIATTIAARCGTCHRIPEPGVRTRKALETALLRHRKRVRLADDQWEAVADYLAEGSGATTPTQLDR